MYYFSLIVSLSLFEFKLPIYLLAINVLVFGVLIHYIFFKWNHFLFYLTENFFIIQVFAAIVFVYNDFFITALFLQYLIPNTQIFNGITWSVVAEYSFYNLFFLYRKLYLLKKSRTTFNVFVIIVASIFLLALNTDSTLLRFPSFIIGVLLAGNIQNNNFLKKTSSFKYSAILSFLLLKPMWTMLGMFGGYQNDYIQAIYYLVVAVVSGWVLLVCTEGNPGKFFTNRFFVFIGKISFSIYLIHEPIGWLVANYLPVNEQPYIIRNVLMVLVLCVIASTITYNYLEKPYFRLKK